MSSIGEAKSQDQLIEALNTAVERRLTARRPYDEQWWNNIALIAGHHYARWAPEVGEFVEKTKRDYQVRLVLNHALTVARTELAKMTKGRPITDVVAQSDEMEDLNAAKVGKRVLDAAEWHFKLRKLRKSAYWWGLLTGLGAIYTGYDHDNDGSGVLRGVIDPNTNRPTFNPEREKELRAMLEEGEITDLEEFEEPLGELEFKVYSPFQLLPDENALEFSQIDDLITMDIMDVDKARAYWGMPDLTPEQGTLGTIHQRMLSQAGGGLADFTPTNPHDPENSLVVYSYWLKPGVYGGKLLRDGYMCRWTNRDVVLEAHKTFPYDDGRIPYSFFEHIPRATTIWPDCVLTHVRQVNLELDRTISQLIENKDYMASPMWLIAVQHDIRGEIVAIPGANIKYRHVPHIPEPKPIHGVPMPQQVENIAAALRDQILDISGQGETSRGRVPAGVRSGVAVAYLQEEDETKLGPTVENMEDFIADQGSKILSRCAQFYTTKRILRNYRRDGEFDVIKFKGADLLGNTDVQVLAGSALPKSKAARQAHVLELVNMGIEKDPKRIKDLLELGQGEADEVDQDFAQAHRENMAMVAGMMGHDVSEFYMAGGPAEMATPQSAGPGLDMAGLESMSSGQQPGVMEPTVPPMEGVAATPEIQAQGPKAVPVKLWHNHEAHLKKHYAFMKGEEFERLAERYPDVVRLFDEHTAMHQQILAQQAMQQLQMQMSLRGGPDGPPGQASEPAQKPPTGEADQRAEATQ